MGLMTGTTLQGDRYVIQDVLDRNDWGITYKAHHQFLDQTVILQTLNETSQQRPDSAQLNQQFLQAVRSIAKSWSASDRQALQVLDCFEENGVPYVVLAYQPEQAAIDRYQWFTLPTNPVPSPLLAPPQATAPMVGDPKQPVPAKQSVPAKQPLPAKQSVPERHQAEEHPSKHYKLDGKEVTVNGFVPSPSDPLLDSAETAVAATLTTGAIDVAHPVAGSLPLAPATKRFVPPLPARPTESPTGSKSVAYPSAVTASATVNVTVGRPTPAPKRRLPIAVMMVSLLGSLFGAGVGLALRLSPESSPGHPPRLSLFQREQAFPSQGNWPIQELPVYEPNPTAIEPLYRTSPIPDYSTPLPSYSPPDAIDPSATAPYAPLPPEAEPPLYEDPAAIPKPSFESDPTLGTEPDPFAEPAPEPIAPDPVLPDLPPPAEALPLPPKSTPDSLPNTVDQ